MKVGTAANAKVAQDIDKQYENQNTQAKRRQFVKNLSNGWSLVGEGASRNAWLGPDGIVYKVCYEESNEIEYENVKKWKKKKLPPEFKIPDATLYMNSRVIAMPFVKVSKSKRYDSHGKDWRWHDENSCTRLRCPKRLNNELEGMGYQDFHTKNVLIDDAGKFWIIDFNAFW